MGVRYPLHVVTKYVMPPSWWLMWSRGKSIRASWYSGVTSATHLAKLLVQLVNLLAVAVEDLHERRLRTSGALRTAEKKRLPNQLDILEVHHQFLRPLRGALADGDGLRDLVVGVAQGRQVLVLHGELGQVADDLGELGQDEIQAVLHEDELAASISMHLPGSGGFGESSRVVRHEARGRAEVDDARGLGGVDAEGVHGGHDVVAADLLLLAGDVERLVRRPEVGPHLVEGLIRDLPSQVRSAVLLGERKPAVIGV